MATCLEAALKDLKEYIISYKSYLPCNLCSKEQSDEDRAEAKKIKEEDAKYEQQFRAMWPHPVDLTVGLLKAEGHYITHLAYGLCIIFVKKA